MDETADTGPAGDSVEVEHDHAWRKAGKDGPAGPLVLGEYACDLCHAIWAM